jgi:hypothetical protein
LIAESDVVAYERDGVVYLRDQFEARWIERLRAAIERDLALHQARAGAPYPCATPATTRATTRGPALFSSPTNMTSRRVRR